MVHESLQWIYALNKLFSIFKNRREVNLNSEFALNFSLSQHFSYSTHYLLIFTVVKNIEIHPNRYLFKKSFPSTTEGFKFIRYTLTVFTCF